MNLLRMEKRLNLHHQCQSNFVFKWWKWCHIFIFTMSYRINLGKMTCEANPAGENRSFIFSLCQICSTLSFYACLCSSTCECQIIFRNPLPKMEKKAIFSLRIIFEQPWKSVAVYSWIRIQSFKRFIFCVNCVYNSWKYVLYSYEAVNDVDENSACPFHIRRNEWVKFQGQLKRLYK